MAINCAPQMAMAECAQQALSLSGARVMLDVRGPRFVSVVAPAGTHELFITRGVEVKRAKRDGLVDVVELQVSRMRAPRDARFEEAVLAGGFVGDRDPAIVTPLPRAERDQLAKTPSTWQLLSGDPGARFVQSWCQADIQSISFLVGLLGDVSLDRNLGQESDLKVLVSFKRTPTAIEFRTDEEPTTPSVLSWPTAERGVATWQGNAYAPAGTFPVKREQDCPTFV